MKVVDPVALFRLSVLGPLVSRERLERGELQQIIRELAQRDYAIPGSRRCLVGEKTIEAWYYAWRRDGIEGLTPKPRNDRGVSKLPVAVQAAVVKAKRENPRRSIRQIRQLLESSGTVARGTLSRSAIHRLLQHQGLSRMTGSSSAPEEHRRFVAEFANGIWYGDVMHGPTVTVNGRRRKVYLVTLMDDASRLIAHSAFCTGETALDIEGVLKQAVLKRGLPRKLVVDNGPAYRAATLQGICARLDIRLIYCRPYAPEGKGKLERWHRTFREQFLSELDTSGIKGLDRTGLPPPSACGAGRQNPAGPLPAGPAEHPSAGPEGGPVGCDLLPPREAQSAQGRHGVLPGRGLRGALRTVRQNRAARRRSSCRNRHGRRRHGG
jgi:putative transposase